jgi:UPF0271 protein
MVTQREVVALDGSIIRIEPDTLCLHGDTAGAAKLASLIRAGLAAAGVRVQSLESPR